MESILTSIKKLLGLGADYSPYDTEIIMHINNTFMTLTQLGVGPANGFRIVDEMATWSEFIPPEHILFGSLETYIYMKVKLIFDPPSSSAVIQAYQTSIKEFEWRVETAVNTPTSE